MGVVRCLHKNLDPKVAEAVEASSTSTSIVVDLWCSDCGASGTAVIGPEDVNWGDDDAIADTIPPGPRG